MIIAKMFELRDHATFIPVIAVLVDPAAAEVESEAWLLRRCGYPYGKVNVILLNARGDVGKTANGTCDPFDWNDRTYQTAHNYIIDNWNSLVDGQVICVEHILGERTTPKESEARNV